MTELTSNYKIVAIINKTLEQGLALNAIAHLGVGLVGRLAFEAPDLLPEIQYCNFRDSDGIGHPFISGRSLIVLRGSNGELRRLRHDAVDAGLPVVDFHSQMVGDTFVEQLARSGSTKEADLVYFGVMTFGLAEQLDPLTRRYSLWR